MRFRTRRAAGRLLASLLLTGLFAASPLSVWPASGHGGTCNRILVETHDRGMVLNSYVISETEYVAKMHAQIDRESEDGVWAVSAGELGSLGYTITYSGLA